MVHRSESELILDQIVFEERNQEYGAFDLRRIYNSHLRNSIIIAASIFTLAVLSPTIASLFEKEKVEEEAVQITEVTLEEPPPIDENQPPPPPPPPVEPPKIATTKFLPPKIMEDEKVTEEEPPPVVEEIKGAVSNKTQEGNDIQNVEVPPEPSAEVGEKVEEAVLWVAEKQSFKGGDVMKFFSKELKYPSLAQNNGVSGRVIVEFIIEKDGSVSNVKAVRGIGSGCDEEAERVIKLTSGMWNPGKNNGHPVRLKMMQPIFFKLPEE